MLRKAMLSLPIVAACLAPAFARDPGYRLVLACVGADVKMEVYLPETVWGSDIARLVNADRDVELRFLAKALTKPVIGYYALDLREYRKGKPLEPVRIAITPDRAHVIIDQHTRGLPRTKIPVSGGVVDFDKRYASEAKCGPFLDK